MIPDLGPANQALITERAAAGHHARVDALEEALRAQPLGLRAEFEPVITHHHAQGVYARQMDARAGAVITSKVHKQESLSILSRGIMKLYDEEGGSRIVCAPLHIVSPPGTRRAAVVLSDCTWTSIHATQSTDLAEIERECVADTVEDYLEWARERIEGAKS